MKLRILNNSICLRLTRSEIETLQSEGLVKAHTDFPGDLDFHYVVESSPASVKPGAFFSNRVMTVRLPDTTVRNWATTDQVSIHGRQLLDGGETLDILVEKDLERFASSDGEEGSA